MLKAHRLAALAAVLVVGAVTPANAVPVTYSTSGIVRLLRHGPPHPGRRQIRFDPIATTVDGP